MDQTTYQRTFSGSKREKALSQALDIRKFEIEMYWKRATYFWSLIAATLAGYVAVQASKDIDEKHFLSLIISCLGLLFAFAWSCVNRGSKQWQENWENHVDMLEDNIQGPLYKTVLRRRPAETGKEKIFYALTGPAPYSVSGINQIISIYVVLLWLFLVGRSLGVLKTPLQISLDDGLIVVATLFSCLIFLVFGRTHLGDHGNVAKRRTSKISVAD